MSNINNNEMDFEELATPFTISPSASSNTSSIDTQMRILENRENNLKIVENMNINDLNNVEINDTKNKLTPPIFSDLSTISKISNNKSINTSENITDYSFSNTDIALGSGMSPFSNKIIDIAKIKIISDKTKDEIYSNRTISALDSLLVSDRSQVDNILNNN